MRTLSMSLALTLLLTALVALAAGAATAGPKVRVLNQGDRWQVACEPGNNAYHIEYMDGDMFVSVEAQFLNDKDEVVHTTTHTLVEHSRMSAQRSFEADKVVDGVKAAAVRFECGSGRARISFGAAETISKS